MRAGSGTVSPDPPSRFRSATFPWTIHLPELYRQLGKWYPSPEPKDI